MSMIDEHYAPIAFQQYAGDPTGHVIPIYIGCLCLDRTPVTPNVYQSTGPGASDWQLVSGGGGGGPSPATTVVGPDAYGDPAVVGTGLLYARDDHDHGLPAAPVAAPLTSYAGVTTATMIPAGVPTDLFNSPSLANGTYLVTMALKAGPLAPTAALQTLELVVAVLSGTATIAGPTTATMLYPIGSADYNTVTVTNIVTVTAPAVLFAQAICAVAAFADNTGSGFTIVKID